MEYYGAPPKTSEYGRLVWGLVLVAATLAGVFIPISAIGAL